MDINKQILSKGSNNNENNSDLFDDETTTDTVVGSSSETSFRYRGPKLNETTRAALTEKWGRWSIIINQQSPSNGTRRFRRRPYLHRLPCHQYSHCDVPRTEFPKHTWQVDVELLQHFLGQAQDLITRAQEAILAEYGQSNKWDLPINKTSLADRSANFQLDFLTLNGTIHPPIHGKTGPLDNGGWTTRRSFQGLVRRLLHAIVTQDTFTFALGGHSIAAGHGNLFKQSYAMQFHRVMEPVFSRLGVQLVTHNFAKGGLGTTQESFGMSGLWGREIDMCMWDSGMTERKSAYYDLFARQALMGGNRVPILWNGMVDVMEVLHNQADVDIGGPGTGLRGIPMTESESQARTLPYAVRYLKCAPEQYELCQRHKYNAMCWIDRPDVILPSILTTTTTTTTTLPQALMETPGQASFHPGFRSHQLTGRVLAFTVLMGLQEAIRQWQNAPNLALADSDWHVSAYYDNIRRKVANLNTTACFKDSSLLPSPRICNIAMKGVTEYTPRVRPNETSIRSIVIDPSFIPPPDANLYDGPDVYNPALEPPDGEVNYLAIVENDDIQPSTKSQQEILIDEEHQRPSSSALGGITSSSADNISHVRQLMAPINSSSITMGRGWELHVPFSDTRCDGTYDSECGRHRNSSCLLYGQNNARGGLVFDSFSGWLLMRLKQLQHGLIIVKLETWQHGRIWDPVEHCELTEGWTEENNGLWTDDRLHIHRRDINNNTNPKVHYDEPRRPKTKMRRKKKAPKLCPEFEFEFAINGHVHTWTKDEFLEKRILKQVVVETWTLLDDPNFISSSSSSSSSSGTTVDVELGIRMQGCGRLNSFKLTHVYWG